MLVFDFTKNQSAESNNNDCTKLENNLDLDPGNSQVYCVKAFLNNFRILRI